VRQSNLVSNLSIFVNISNGFQYLRNFILTQALSGNFSESKPESWRQTTLGKEVEIIRGITFPSSAKFREPANERIVCLRTTNIQDQVDWADLLYVPESYVKNSGQYIRKNDILISMANSRELVGKVSLVTRDDVRCTLGGFISAIRCSETILPEFLMILLRVPATREKIIDSSTQTTNIANISLGRLRPLEISLPSISEQHKIIQKVAQLLEQCDNLETTFSRHKDIGTAARKSAVDAISTAQSSEELQIAWERIQQNWEVVAGTPESIASLRNLIRELAVRGLVTNMVQNFRNQSQDSQGFPFIIPDSWRWVALGDVSDFFNGFAFGSNEYISKGVGVIRMSDMKSGSIVKDHMKFVSKDRLSSLSETFQVKPGDIVMGMTGATLGKPCVNKTAETFLLNQRIGKFIPKGINPDYLLLALEYLERSFMSLSFGTGVNNLSTQQIKKSLIPLPPAEEQIQIVSIVSDLFSICDRLELSLITCQEIADKFARSVTSSSVQISSHA
jgi:type I restriction enzyme S subunit